MSRTRSRNLKLAASIAAAAAIVALWAPPAQARGNASAAAGFIEDAQNKDGGFGAHQGKQSDPRATLWASVALLAAGKNPRDEFLKRGRSADDYLVAHRSQYTTLGDLGLLTVVQRTGRFGAALYGNPGQKLTDRLSQDVVRTDPKGVALAVFGLLAVDTDSSRQKAASAAQALLASRTSDGAWGPKGNADSVSTALVLQALAATGAAGTGNDAVRSGLAYLHAAQTNDGSIIESTRLDKATTGGSVAATAFTLQALDALGVSTLKTSSGKSVRQGLTQYQQRGSGGLTSKGSQYSIVAPSVIETAQAFPAFDGATFPLAAVRSTTGGPSLVKQTHQKGQDESSNRVSSGTAAQGVSGRDATAGDPGAFRRASANGNGKSAKGGASATAKQGRTSTGSGGTDVSGQVVGTGPRLAKKAGASDTGLTREQVAMLWLLGTLVALFALGGTLERRRPRPPDAPPLIVVALTSPGTILRPALRWGARVSGIALVRSGKAPPPRRRWALLPVLAMGLALIALPFAIHLFDRAPKGATMIGAFEPYMKAERVDGYQRDVRQIDEYAAELQTDAPRLLVPEVTNEAAARRELFRRNQELALFSKQWPKAHGTLTNLLDTIHDNRSNYDAVAALPSFRLFPWFFVIPGALLVLLAGTGLAFGRHAWIPVRRATIALGIGLLLAPVLFQMFDRAPKGAKMVDAFQTIETRATVQEVQGHFGTIAVGQGGITGELMPALKGRGLSNADIKRELPAVTRLNDAWVGILNQMTPMIGVMSDNVANYQAVAALPSFSLFTWLFVVPGLLVVGLALLAGTRLVRVTPEVRSEPVAA